MPNMNRIREAMRQGVLNEAWFPQIRNYTGNRTTWCVYYVYFTLLKLGWRDLAKIVRDKGIGWTNGENMHKLLCEHFKSVPSSYTDFRNRVYIISSFDEHLGVPGHVALSYNHIDDCNYCIQSGAFSGVSTVDFSFGRLKKNLNFVEVKGGKYGL